MRRFIPFLLSVFCVATIAAARPPFAPAAKNQAQPTRAQAVAAIRSTERQMHNFRFVEYPRLVRELDRQIRLAEAETLVAADRVENYRGFRSFNFYTPAYNAEQSWRLQTLASHQHVQRLREQRAELTRYRRDVIRQLRGDINRGVAVLAAMDAAVE
ncbi:hypothetical protein [Adhaeretor mobilis]|uniref:Uncharacterized protein n=1 Tax=Adhaeretor mobilis TaxID=1930276 RepID=A0A517N087_9BACT|nr:hypothetical protein [Adhaeretor mobilis]QDT00543.1 hypothetical protein HG15A2_38810 [Adhaeretor mobilis]